jgi:D-3-phosphoglycerate dehydrogenase
MILISCPIHDVFIQSLKASGKLYVHLPDISREELIQKIPEIEGLVISTRITIDKPILEKAKRLRWIARLGSGMEHIDLSYAKEKGINYYSSPEGNCMAVAEHALGMLLSYSRHICKSNLEVRDYAWNRQSNKGVELSGKKLGIIGYGHTGSAFARILRGFDMEIMAHDKYKKGWGDERIRETDLQTIQDQCDIISFHLPLTEETRYYANDSFFQALQKKPVLINTSRGNVLQSGALLQALENNLVSGACLDVLENENATEFKHPRNENIRKLILHPKVLVTPHIAGYSFEADEKMALALLKKLDFLP